MLENSYYKPFLMTFCNPYSLAAFAGLFAGLILSIFGVLTGQEAVDYYAEVHTSTWNSFVHTVGMPFTYLGFNLAVPALFRVNDPWKLQMCVYIAYMVHYATIDFTTAVITSVVYLMVVKYAYNYYMQKFTPYLGYLGLGLLVSTTALLVQEFFGHYLGGDDPSRAEGVFNAILYAKFYSIQHLISGILK